MPEVKLADLRALVVGFPGTGATDLANWFDAQAGVTVSTPRETFSLCPEFATNHRRAGGLTLDEAFPEGCARDGVAPDGAAAPALVEASALNVYSDALRARMARTSVGAIAVVGDPARAMARWHARMVLARDRPDRPLREAWERSGDGARQDATPTRLKSSYRLMFRQGFWTERWVRALGHERVLVLSDAELDAPGALAARLSPWLGVTLSGETRVRSGASPRERAPRWARRLGAPVLRRALARADRDGRLGRALDAGLHRLRPDTPPDPGAALDPELRAEIHAWYRSDAERLSALLDANRAVHDGHAHSNRPPPC